jgi:2,3-dihydroxyphenylpropionate 1,2-dioxygenase
MTSQSHRPDRAFVCLSHSPFMTLPDRSDTGYEYRAAVEEAKSFIGDFGPDVVVVFAPDHMNLLNQVRPPFTGILSGGTLPEFGIPRLELNVHPVAKNLYQDLVSTDVDLAVGEGVDVDHGLGLTLTQLFDDPGLVPLVPLIVNAIGFPLFPVARARRVGEHIGRALRAYDGKAMFIGTGGLSHNPPFPAPVPGARRFSAKERTESLSGALDYIDPVWDRALLTGLTDGDPDCFSGLSQADIDARGGGANEVRTWAAAWAAAGSPAATFTSYEVVEPWITGMGVAFGTHVRSPRG